VTLLDSYFPFDTGPGSTATPANWRQMARLWYGSGVVPGNQNQLASTISGTTVTIQPGAVWVDGFYGQSAANKQVTGVSGTGTVVARLDVTSRQIYFMFVPTVVQNPAANFDIPLYSVAGGVLTDVRQFCNADPQKIARGKMVRVNPYSTSTAVQNYGFDTVIYGSNWSGYTFVCPYAADYLCIAQVGFASSAAGQWYNIRLAHNNVLVAWSGTSNATVAGAAMVVRVQDIVPCKVGDTLYIQHNCSTNALQGYVGAAQAYFSVRSMS
jgi:hypothetical protein